MVSVQKGSMGSRNLRVHRGSKLRAYVTVYGSFGLCHRAGPMAYSEL